MKKNKLYVYILYETFVVSSSYILSSISILGSLIAIFFNYNTIINNSILENIVFGLVLMLFYFVIALILLLPYVFYIPGDGSCIESILKNSGMPHAQILIDLKKEIFKKK